MPLDSTTGREPDRGGEVRSSVEAQLQGLRELISLYEDALLWQTPARVRQCTAPDKCERSECFRVYDKAALKCLRDGCRIEESKKRVTDTGYHVPPSWQTATALGRVRLKWTWRTDDKPEVITVVITGDADLPGLQAILEEMYAAELSLERRLPREGGGKPVEAYDPDAYMAVKDFMESWNDKAGGGIGYPQWKRAKRSNPWFRFDPLAPKYHPRLHRADAERFLRGLDRGGINPDTFEMLDYGQFPSVADAQSEEDVMDEYLAGVVARKITIRAAKRAQGH